MSKYGKMDFTRPLPKLHRGVLYVGGESDKVPIYIVERLEDGNYPEVVRVYDVQKDSDPPIKAFVYQKVRKEIRATTAISRLAAKFIKPEEYQVRVEKPPLYISPIVEGKDTFTGFEGDGFLDKEPDKLMRGEGKIILEEGKPTGVFITLASIKWDIPVIAKESVVDEYEALKYMYYH